MNWLAACAPIGARRHERRGVTIVELMIALLIALIMLVAIFEIFSHFGNLVNEGRVQIEMAGQTRAFFNRLEQDLKGATVQTLPWNDPKAGGGYLEIIEGPAKDPTGLDTRRTQLTLGDYDDILAFTAASKGEPFVAKLGGQLRESHQAEIIYFAVPDPETPNVAKLYRKVIPLPYDTNGNFNRTIETLVLRENRFGRPNNFPYELTTAQLAASVTDDDIVLRDVLAFDVKVFDPGVEEKDGGGDGPLSPGDAIPGGDTYASAPSYAPQRWGAYVDLGSDVLPSGATFIGPPRPLSGLSVPTWDTWPLFYEHDGVDNPPIAGGIDPASDGLDNDNANGVDDPLERETSPPYPFPLRGIQVRLRVIEPASKQIRQTTMKIPFAPQ